MKQMKKNEKYIQFLNILLFWDAPGRGFLIKIDDFIKKLMLRSIPKQYFVQKLIFFFPFF